MRALLVHVRPHRRTLVLAAVPGAARTHTELVEAGELHRGLAATQRTA